MTRKQRRLVEALAAGMDAESAAKAAGYNYAYAVKKMAEPAVQAVVERLREARQHPQPVKELETDDERRPASILWGIIEDPLTDQMARISAVRALIAYERAHAADLPAEKVYIIDDIPDDGCPSLEDTKNNGIYIRTSDKPAGEGAEI